MSITKFFAKTFTSGIPDSAGDRFYAQDLTMDFHYLRDVAGHSIQDLMQGASTAIAWGLVPTQNGTATSINLTAGAAYASFAVTMPNSPWGVPPPVTSQNIDFVRIYTGALSAQSASTATLDGTTINYVKIAYQETTGQTRTRAHKSGSYAFENAPSFVLTINSTAPASNEVCLGSFVGTSGNVWTWNYSTYRAMSLTPSLVGPAIVSNSNRNALINGEMAIDNRNAGASQTFTAGGALAYSVDRWWGACTGANVTGQQVSVTGWPDSRKYAYQFTGLASNTGVQFGQRIEMINSYQFANKPICLSAYMRTSTAKTVTWTAYYATTDDTFGTLASPTKTQIATGTWAVTSAYQRFSATFTGPTETNSHGIEIVFSVPTLLGSETWAITGAQIELGTVPTVFEKRSYDQELTSCLRYLPFWKLGVGGTYSIIGYGISNSATNVFCYTPFRVTPRVPPTGLTISSPSHLSSGVPNVTSIGAISTITFSQANYDQMQYTVSGGSSSGNLPTIIADSGTGSGRYLYASGVEL